MVGVIRVHLKQTHYVYRKFQGLKQCPPPPPSPFSTSNYTVPLNPLQWTQKMRGKGSNARFRRARRQLLISPLQLRQGTYWESPQFFFPYRSISRLNPSSQSLAYSYSNTLLCFPIPSGPSNQTMCSSFLPKIFSLSLQTGRTH